MPEIARKARALSEGINTSIHHSSAEVRIVFLYTPICYAVF